MKNNKAGSVLILGGGIAGMQSALDLANSGIKVYMVEKKPGIGGVMAMLDKTFPTNDCSMCILAPRLVEIARHKDIELITLADILEVKGEPGNYRVILRKNPRYVNIELCTGCGECVRVCPVGKIKEAREGAKLKPVPDEFNMALSNRPAIYIMYPQTVPNKAVIDRETCIYFDTGKCQACVKACPTGAIDFEQKEEIEEINVGAIILSPGYEIFDPSVKEDLGYGKYPNVVTSLQFERILSPTGPYEGHVLRPSDRKEPERIAFIQCVGSREIERDYCSSVCCMYATKEAIIAKEHMGDVLKQVDIYFMDVRAFSKGFEEYFERAKEEGVNYIRCRTPKIEEDPNTRNLRITYLADGDKKLTKEYDLVVLSVGLLAPKDAGEIADKFKIELNGYNFAKVDTFDPVKSKEGVYVAGVFSEPKDIPETVIQASAASSKALSLLGDVKGTLIKPLELPPERDVKDEEPRIGVFVCHCGTNIAGVVDVKSIAEYAKTLPDVVYSETLLFACSTDSQERIKEVINEQKLNRVVVAACTPRTHEPLFHATLKEAGLNPYLFELASIREHDSWVHMFEKEKATEKAKDVVRRAVAKLKLAEPLSLSHIPVNKKALVVGGGVAGMVSALEIANQGYEVVLVEKEKELGGNARNLYYSLNGDDPQEFLKELIEKVKSHEKIEIFTQARLENVEGSVGNFKTTINVNGNTQEIEHGVIIIATGAQEYKPTEYLYGKDKKVLTQIELEGKITKDSGFKNDLRNKTFVMIQCVGSRDEERPYCSRICCMQAIKNALKIKEISEDAEVYVLYRDIRTYGFKEKYYTLARQKGVRFIRFNENKKPEVKGENGKLTVSVFDEVLGIPAKIEADYLVLSTGVVPNEDAREISQLCKFPVGKEGFFLEAHMKLRPVDFQTDGLFLTGLAHFPKTLEETIVQAQAASGRAGIILSKDYIESEPYIAVIDEEKCSGCHVCIALCPYNAISFDHEKEVARIDEALCKGCGACVGACPSKAIVQKHFRDEQIFEEIKEILVG